MRLRPQLNEKDIILKFEFNNFEFIIAHYIIYYESNKETIR